MLLPRLREEVLEANLELVRRGLVLYTFGNASGISRDQKLVVIKPSGVPYDKMKPEHLVITNLEGRIAEGNLRPSSDLPTHLVLYKAFPEIGGVVHTHSEYATAWAQAQRDIPVYGTTHADHHTVSIPCAPPMEDEMIKGDYEHQTGFQVLNYFRDHELNYEEVEMILVGSHAPFTWGKTPEKAVYNSAVLESIAKMAYLTEQINSNAPTLKDALIKKHYERKHGPDSYYGQ